MKVKALNINWEKVPSDLKKFISPNQTFITSGKEYSVYALSVYMKVVFVLVIDDSYTPVFLPSWIFETLTTDIPKDWICNLRMGNDVEMVMGPEFLARDLEAYNSMVDQESDQLERFWLWCKRSNGLERDTLRN